MYAKLSLRNIKRSAIDYLIYLITLTICVGMFYSFMSISSAYYKQSLSIEFNIDMLKDSMGFATIIITSILLFLIKYVNNYMIKRKQKEFGIQAIMGMEQKIMAYLFFVETLIMGIIAVFLGIIVGAFISQIITSIIMESYGQEYKVYFSLFPDTMLITIVFFLIVFCIVGITNIKTIRKIKIIDMINANKKSDSPLEKDKTIPIFILITSILSCIMFIASMNILQFYDNRFDISIKITLVANIALPLIFMTICVVYFIKYKNKKNSTKLVAILSIISILLLISCISMNGFIGPLADEIIDRSIKNMYIGLAVIFLFFSVFGLFYCVTDLILIIKNNCEKLKYKEENLFLFGQLIDKLKTNFRTMAIITITLSSAIVALILGPIVSNWSLGYLDKRTVFDVEISSEYNEIGKIENLPKNDYEFVVKYLEKNNHKMKDYVQVEHYFLKEDDFYRRLKTDFPILAISVSDYNNLRKVAGLEQIYLGDNEYATQWNDTSLKNEIYEFIKKNQSISVGENKLYISQNGIYKESLGESLYNLYTDLVYILPDEICNNLTMARIEIYGNTEKTIPYDLAKRLETYIEEEVFNINENTENITWTSIKTVEVNDGISMVLMIKLLIMYLGVILIIICFTILSLQQILDSSDFRYRFGVLRKIGVSEKGINSIVLKQMGVWFGIPIIMAIIYASTIIIVFIKYKFKEVMAYIGMKVLVANISIMCGVIILILSCYFITTWIMFKKNINSRD